MSQRWTRRMFVSRTSRPPVNARSPRHHLARACAGRWPRRRRGGPVSIRPRWCQHAAAIRHPLLAAWGRDSREIQLVLGARLATAALEDRHHPLPPATGAPSLLQRLQASIRADQPPSPHDRPVLGADDRSLQVHSCHGRARQAEVVRDAITHLLAADPTLEPRDVVVLCPDIDEMAPLLHAAFGRGGAEPAPGDDAATPLGLPALPYRLADRSIRQTNPVLGAMAEVLALVEGRFTASQVLALAALPPVRERDRRPRRARR